MNNVHIKENIKKARNAMEQVGSIGERKISIDFKKRMFLLHKLIMSILLYRVEIGG